MEDFTKGILLIIKGLGLLLFSAFALAWPVQLLWNGCLLDAMDGLHSITFLQALGLNFLFAILFKSQANAPKPNFKTLK